MMNLTTQFVKPFVGHPLSPIPTNTLISFHSDLLLIIGYLSLFLYVNYDIDFRSLAVIWFI